MKKVIHVDDHSGELHCDNPQCDYVAPPGLHQWGPHLIGLPCPECGSNLLTIQDYHVTLKMDRMVNRINRFFAFFGLGTETLDGIPADQIHSVGIRHHDGKTIINTDK